MKQKVILVLGLGALVALIAYGLSLLPHWVVLVWAILATLALPLGIAGAWNLGRYEATATLKGFELGLTKLSQIMTFRVKPVVKMSESQFYLPPMIQDSAVDGEVVEL